MSRAIRIGTRGSKLALAQAGLVKEALEKAHPEIICTLEVMKTSGDDFSAGKAEMGETTLKGLFVKELEEALFKGTIDCAVHSVKDMETDLPPGLKLAAVMKREDPRDALVAKEASSLKNLPASAVVGVSSLRRQAQLKRLRRDLDVRPIRGNVDTRLKKLDDGEYGALILAGCGLRRLGWEKRISEWIDPAVMLPAPGQGALGIEIAEERKELSDLFQALEDADSHWEIRAERALLKALGGSCRVPVGALAHVEGENITLRGVVLSPEGLKLIQEEISGAKKSAERLGTELASHLRAAGADRLLYGNWTQKAGAASNG